MTTPKLKTAPTTLFHRRSTVSSIRSNAIREYQSFGPHKCGNTRQGEAGGHRSLHHQNGSDDEQDEKGLFEAAYRCVQYQSVECQNGHKHDRRDCAYVRM